MSEPIRIQPKQGPLPGQGTSAAPKAAASGSAFAKTLEQVQKLTFSNHAQKRLEARNINISDEGLKRLSQAVDKADRRGGKESLVLMDDMSFIVNVKDRMVITALDAQSRGEGVFTQIDSVVFADPGSSMKSDQENQAAASGQKSFSS
ncbi:MAG TPA: TIGR02530 family flagellar biosynthesis protein [Anaerolineaceae bacterium]|nr:TIGR02530 family flagellar biosynthesis protein [Anaerolineaceae bacterium]